MGHDPFVYSIKQKSPIPGAVYLHEPVVGMTPEEPDGAVTFMREGERDVYAQKVYGRADAPVSWDTFPTGEYAAWSMHDLYDRLWNEYSGIIVDQKLDDDLLVGMEESYPLVISSVPARVLCNNSYHFFNGTQVWITDEAWRDCPDNTIVYNGEPGIPWYRTSRIFGYGATEFPAVIGQAGPAGAFRGTKPTETNCDCHPNIQRVGRFGQWKKGVLVHHAYRQAMEVIEWHAGLGACA
jgi:hypothetical protein